MLDSLPPSVSEPKGEEADYYHSQGSGLRNSRSACLVADVVDSDKIASGDEPSSYCDPGNGLPGIRESNEVHRTMRYVGSRLRNIDCLGGAIIKRDRVLEEFTPAASLEGT